MITIDGSYGEGGGQILRSSLALSLVTGKPFCIENIRAGRKKPGLMRQHLTAVNAAVEIGGAEVTGNTIGSQRVTFAPKGIQAGQYHFAVGTAGSTTLVLQTVLPALMIADGPSELVLEGGTHNPLAPPFSFLEKAFVPLLNRMGPTIGLELFRPGFYPAGGGKFKVTIEPADKLNIIEIIERGEILRKKATAYVAHLPEIIGQRELEAIRKRITWDECDMEIVSVNDSIGPGNIVTAEIESKDVCEVFTGFGMKGVPAQSVANEMIKEIREYLIAEVPVGSHLADQLLIPMAMAGGGRFRTLPLTMHSKTNIEIVQKFLDVRIHVDELDDKVHEVSIFG